MSDLQLTPPGYTHAELVGRAASWLANRQNCRFVLREVNALTGECPDAIGWKYSYQSHLVEVKVSRSDFFADRDKPFRKQPERGVGMFRWFMAPAGLLTAEDVKDCLGWGLLAVRGRSVQTVVKAEAQLQVNQESEICVLVQAVANAQLCAPMDLNDWFAHPESAVGRTRAFRRELGNRQREIDLERTCGALLASEGDRILSCIAAVASGYSRCSVHGGRTRGEKRKQTVVQAEYEAKREGRAA